MTMWYRECPLCENEIEYTNKRSWYNAKRLYSKCIDCQKTQLSEIFTGRQNSNYPANRRSKLKPTKLSRKCPDCKKMLYYGRIDRLKFAIKKNTVCDSCANYKYKKTFNNVIDEDAIKKMRATKSGFTSWEEYEKKYPMKKAYINKVHQLTRKQPLHNLSNYSKLEENWGRMGDEGAYQIDHIISIDTGWKLKMAAEEIAHITNLQVMKWEDNRSKGA